jgi:ribosomal protein S18 acetylase RimI-like enzyme
MYDVEDLSGYTAASLHPVVSGAFADYVIPMRTDVVQLDALLTRRGWEPAWSRGLSRDGRLVGFWLTGTDDVRGEAYCIMAGILPEARGSGGIDAMFGQVRAAASGRAHRLEVIRGNDRAARAYRRLGFETARVLHYYELLASAARLGEPGWPVAVEPGWPVATCPRSWWTPQRAGAASGVPCSLRRCGTRRPGVSR